MWRNVDTKAAMMLLIPATREDLAKLKEKRLRDSEPLTELERIRIRERTV